MNYKVIYNEELDSLMGSFEGDLDVTSLGEFIAEIERMAQEYPCKRILNDFRKAIFNLSIIDVYETPGQVIKQEFNHSWKRAVLVGEEQMEKAQFFEDAAINRGVKVKVFTAKDKAIEWLKS